MINPMINHRHATILCICQRRQDDTQVLLKSKFMYVHAVRKIIPGIFDSGEPITN